MKVRVKVDLLDAIADNWDTLDNDIRARLIEKHPSLYFAVAKLAR